MLNTLTIFAISSVVVFLFGLLVGGQVSTKASIFTHSNLQVAVGMLVSTMWVASIVAEIVMPAYTASVLVHGLMGAVVGYFFSEDGLNINVGGGE